MVQPDPALGIDVNFDNDGFRNAIHFSMQMGMNPDPDRRPKFVKKSTERAYWKNDVELDPADVITGRSGEPLDPDVDVRVPDDELIEVDCAVETDEGQAGETGVGSFKPTKLTITLLDVDYELVRGCKELVYNGDRYIYDQEPESMGLFEVGVYVVQYKAWDES